MNINLGRTSLTVNATTQNNVWTAIENDSPFPDGQINIGALSAQYADNSIPISTGIGSGATLTASFSVGAQTGIGVFDTPAAALAALNLDKSLTPAFPDSPNSRYLLFSFSLSPQVGVSATAPIGVVGSVTFGAKASASTLFAVLYRFDKNTGAATALAQGGAAIKLPREVQTAADLPQGACIIAEVNGSLALSLQAQAGYDYTYTRTLPDNLQELKFSGDWSVKVDAAATATVGYNISGNYYVTLGHLAAGPDQVLQLKVNKGDSYGYNLGLNLSAGVQMSDPLPTQGSDLVAASFGVFGPQIVTDVSNSLTTLSSWSTGDLAANTAALTIKSAKDLLHAVTGEDVDAAIATATGKLKDALTSWTNLVQKGSNDLQTLVWNLLGNPLAADQQLVLKLLTDLKTQPTLGPALSDGLQSVLGQSWLTGIVQAVGADSVLTLGDHQADVQTYAGYALNLLQGNVFQNLQQYIVQRFGLTTLMNALNTASDPTQLDQWVEGRLAALLNKSSLVTVDLKKIQTAMSTLEGKFNGFYDKLTAALTKKYNFQFAASYEKSFDNNTQLDLTFDLSQQSLVALYQDVIKGDTSAIFRLGAAQAGLTINSGVMTHGIHSTAKTSLALPFLSPITTTDINNSVATLTIDRNGANLVGSLDATDQVTNNRYRSMLELAIHLGIQAKTITSIDSSLAFETRTFAKNATKAMVVQATKPFVDEYMPGKFGTHQYTDVLLADFDNATTPSTSVFGDMVMSTQLAIDGDFLSAWVVPPDRLLSAQIIASATVQRAMRKYAHQLYFSKNNSIYDYAAEMLLVWQSLPVCTGVQWDGNDLGSTNTDQSYYYDTHDANLLTALVNLAYQSKSLTNLVQQTITELINKGVPASSFSSLTPDGAAVHMKGDTLQSSTVIFLHDTILAESGVVEGVANALKKMSDAAGEISVNDPSKMLDSLAQFGTDLTTALNKYMRTTIADADNLRLFGPMLFVELTQALANGTPAIQPKAMVELKALKPSHTFDITSYVTGSEPGSDQVAVAQTIVNV